MLLEQLLNIVIKFSTVNGRKCQIDKWLELYTAHKSVFIEVGRTNTHKHVVWLCAFSARSQYITEVIGAIL